MSTDKFIHLFEAGEANATALLLLHGTGGSERDLLPLAREIAPRAPLLSLRGSVLEGNMPRFFKRHAEGVFDLEDMRIRTGEIIAFLKEALPEYGLQRENLIAFGYSNGANMASSLIFTNPSILAGGILLRPMVPFAFKEHIPDLHDKRILLLGGARDPIAPPAEVQKLERQYRQSGARVTTVIHTHASHGLDKDDLLHAARFIEQEWDSQNP